jgi:hypothetical protein
MHTCVCALRPNQVKRTHIFTHLLNGIRTFTLNSIYVPTEAEWSSQTAARNNGNKSITTVKEEPAPTIANKVSSVTKLSVSSTRTAPGHFFNPAPPC